MGVKDWSTSAAAMSSAPVGGTITLTEGQLAPTLNDAMRQILAEIRSDIWEGIEWRDWGLAITYVSGTSFKVTGDYSSVYHVGRRVRVTGTNTGTKYGTITAVSVLGGDTTVTLSIDASGTISSDANLAASVGFSASTVPYGTNVGIPAGTRMFFQQAAAPAGWTTEAVYGDRAIRVARGSEHYTAPKTFTHGFTAHVFKSSKTTAAQALTEAQMPPHKHWTVTAGTVGNAGISTGVTLSIASARNSPANDDRYVLGSGGTADSCLTSQVGSGDNVSWTVPEMDLSYVDAVIGIKT